MSEEDDSDIESGENDEEDEEDDDDEEEEETNSEVLKQAKLQEDVELLSGIFQHFDNLSRRVASKRELLQQAESMASANNLLETKVQQLQRCIDQQQVEIARLTRDEESDLDAPPR